MYNLKCVCVFGKNKCKGVSGHRSDRFNRGGANIGGGIGFFSTSPFICVFVLFCVFVFMFCVFVFLFCVFVKDRTTPREGLDFSFMRCSILI